MRTFLLLALAATVPARAQISCQLVGVETVPEEEDNCYGLVHVRMLCTGGTPTPAGTDVPLVNITLNADAPISYPSLAVIDTSSNINTGNHDISGFLLPVVGVGGSGVNYSNGSVQNTFFSVQNSSTSVTWRNVAFDPSPNGRTLDLQFYVRLCDTNGSSSAPFRLTIKGALVATGTLLIKPPPSVADGPIARDTPTTYTVTPSSLDLGGVLPCWHKQVIAGSAPANTALNANLLGSSPSVPAAASATLNFSALFPSCLWTRATGFQDNFTQFYDNDLGLTFPDVPPPFANFGTEFQAVFNNIPAGVSVFVQTSITSPVGTVLLTSPGTAVGSAGLTQIPVTKGSATAIWETQSASTTATGTFAIPVYFAFQPGVPSPSHITVVQSLTSGPGGVQFLQPPANLIQPVAFSINTGASAAPKMTATVDSRPCIIGVTFWTNNACSPGSGLFVNVVSDTASVVENQPTFTSAGGVTSFGLTSSITPTLTQIFPKASNATPGAYPQTMTITAAQPAGTSSVNVPFTVTVLPPNNPVFELNAVFDAFSYQSETIAPGQIYTIFGNNFGPSTLVSGTLDVSGKLSTTVANTQVMFDGIASPLLYVVNGQLSGVAPFGLAGKTSTNVQIVYNGLTSPAVAVPVVPASISIASADSSGGNGAVVINQDGTLNTVSNPASVGDTVVIYASYAGPFANGVTGTDGRTTTGPPYPVPAGTPSVSVGGVQATNIPYFGNAPGFLESVMQINVVIPPGVVSSPYNPLVIAAGGATSVPWTSIAVQ